MYSWDKNKSGTISTLDYRQIDRNQSINSTQNGLLFYDRKRKLKGALFLKTGSWFCTINTLKVASKKTILVKKDAYLLLWRFIENYYEVKCIELATPSEVRHNPWSLDEKYSEITKQKILKF